MAQFNWTCPHCDRPQTVTDPNHENGYAHLFMKTSALGDLGIKYSGIVCSNPDCRQPSVVVGLYPDKSGPNGWFVPGAWNSISRLSLIPQNGAKPQPSYIPEPIIEDYKEACAIRDLSPKASATLARRCLQGMIRDFCGISRPRLIDEVKHLRLAVANGDAPRSVSIESVDAIDHVRTVGNIGAHMEADINHIVPVETGEAQLLIDLIEMLFQDWYVDRQTRGARLSAIASLAEDKKALVAAGKNPLGLLANLPLAPPPTE